VKLLLALVCSAALWAADPIVLFDGKTPAGWLEVTGLEFPTESWHIGDGCLRAVNSGRGYRDIRTEAVFGSFEFQFDWKIEPGGNSGVKYLVQKTDRWTNAIGLQARARGLEFQLVDNRSPDGSTPNKSCGSLYGVIAPARDAARPPGEFNHATLVVRGTHVEHWLNGVKVVEFETGDPAVRKVLADAAGKNTPVSESFISLQNHGTPVWFRNLNLRRIER
jgi:3-keto-disaccharide hydrolase